MQTLLAKDIMTATDVAVSPKMPIPGLVKFLREQRIGGAPVFEDGKMIGIVTVADVFVALQIVQRMHLGKLMRFSQLFDMGKKMITVKDIYRENPVSVQPETPIEKVLSTMVQEDLYTLPVMNADRTAVLGVIGRHDITWAIFGS